MNTKTTHYVHTASDGTKTIVNVLGEDRWHVLPDGRKMVLPHIPNDIAGRYAAHFYSDLVPVLGPRRAYRRFHDDYMLASTQPEWGPWSLKVTYPYRAQYRISGVINGSQQPRREAIDLAEISTLIDGDPWGRGCF